MRFTNLRWQIQVVLVTYPGEPSIHRHAADHNQVGRMYPCSSIYLSTYCKRVNMYSTVHFWSNWGDSTTYVHCHPAGGPADSQEEISHMTFVIHAEYLWILSCEKVSISLSMSPYVIIYIICYNDIYLPQMIYLWTSDPCVFSSTKVSFVSSISWAGPGAYDPKVNSVLMGIPRWKAGVMVGTWMKPQSKLIVKLHK